MLLYNKEVKILIIDDDEDDYFIIADYIKDIPDLKAIVDWKYTYDDGLQAIKSKKYDIYFVDYLLGARSGVDLLKEAIDSGCEEPIIMLTGQGNYDIDIQAMKIGAVDYQVKSDLNSVMLERTLRYALDRTANLKALKANERKYRNIFKRSKDIMFVADNNLTFSDINNAVFEILAYTPEECINNISLYNFIADQETKDYISNELKDGGEILDKELILKSKNGDDKICSLTISKEISPDDEARNYYQGIIHDITNLKKMEKATVQSAKLGMAGRLVRTLAHEVRNPLNNISLSVEQVEEEATESVMPFLNIISRNAGRINDIIGELLNSSRPAEIVLAQVDLGVLVKAVVEEAKDRLTLKKIRLKETYETDELYIMADEKKLVLALRNIVTNAIEAMEEETGQLSVGIMQNDDKAVVFIKDNGCGISQDNLPYLFEPYFTQKRNGMGLGLAHTLNILQGHGGEVEVTSQIDEGTLFYITFPGI